MENKIDLKFEEQIYDVRFNDDWYKVTQIFDWESGDFDYTVIKYDGESNKQCLPSKEERENVLEYFHEEGEE